MTHQQLVEALDQLERKVHAQGVDLAATQERMRTLFEHAPMSIQLIDRSGKTLQVNAAWRELWGIPDDFIKSYILRDYNILEDPQLKAKGIAPYFHRALAGQHGDIPAICYDPAELGFSGRARWVEGHVYPVKDADGNVQQLVLIHEDVTARREAEELILRKSAEFEAIFRHLPDPVIMASATREIVLVNPAANALLGYAPDELTGRPVSDIYATNDDFERLGDTRHNPQSTSHEPSTYEMRYRHKSGEVILTETTSSVVRMPNGTVIGYVGIIRDVRERRRDEQMMRFVSDAGDVLASSLDYAETLSALARLAVPTLGDWCIIDLLEEDGSVRRADIVFADARHEALRHQIARFTPRRDHLHHPPARALFEARPILIPVVDRAEIAQMAQNDEHARVIASTGVHSMICVPLVARSRTIGVLTLMQDRTNIAYTEKDLSWAKQLANKAAQAVENSRLYQKATEAIAARDEFMGVCSHELKTPLTSMKLQLQVAAQQMSTVEVRTALPDSFSKRLTVATRQLRRLEKLIEDMLDVSRIVTGKLTMRMERVSLTDIVVEAVDQTADTFQTAGVRVDVAVEQQIEVHGDRVRLAQVLDNLLSNALKYGGGKPVEVHVRRDGDRAQVAVVDHGPGIEASDLHRIFKRFERGNATKDSGGLGLGLYISQQIAEAHAGIIRVDSEPGRGACFVFDVPAV